MQHKPSARKPKPDSRFPKIQATQCACCGIALPTGAGYDVPLIGAVGPKCALKFASFADALVWVEGRNARVQGGDRVAHVAAHNVVVGLRNLGIEITADAAGVLHVGRLTRKASDVASTYKRVRARFEGNLQAAVTAYGPSIGTTRAVAA
ncbi:hypothetical protein [Deinococcus multiflagellatus]|uniref:Uncharacterized protein n=1 Tax=Deinococcus multiflagellatus TaxID=1656887 RepID=A0ABW1ZQ31_9DEIO|nr:hypothetical protein [Deinococcus multiflagellatus]MBZ9715547.1 hypothetical protein [Deinococcus multiflagellatus]